MNASRFTGPLFIIGIGRSGTKLLRDLLNRNPGIGIPTAETCFIPYMVIHFGNPPRFARNTQDFGKFYQKLSQTAFFWYMERKGCMLSKEQLYRIEDRTSWNSIFEFILRFYAPAGRDQNFIWGDKTPGPIHMSNMTLLKAIFPTAKFLHIIRDPRDVCLSGKKAWGISLYRTASLWREQIVLARSSARQMGQDYNEVFYESLLEDPEVILRGVCEFLGCDFVPAMMTLERSLEYDGDARGQTHIVRDNKHKYMTQLSLSEIRRIEQIACPTMRATGYNPEHDVEFEPLSPLVLQILTLSDMWATLGTRTREKGLYEGLRFYARELRPYLGSMGRRFPWRKSAA